MEELIPTDVSSFETARWIWKHLVPKSGQATTVQGELLRAVEKLRWEAQSNGNINWDDRFVMLVEYLASTLLSEPAFTVAEKVQLKEDMDRLLAFELPDVVGDRYDQITESKEELVRLLADKLPYVDDDLYDRITESVVAYCRLHPAVIPREMDPEQYR